MNINLSPQQQKVVSAGITTLAAMVVVTAVVVLVFYSALFFKTFSHVFLPLAVAAIFAMVLDPWYEWLHKRMPTALALVAVFLSIIIPLVAIIWFFGALIADQMAGLLDQLPVWWDRATTWFDANRTQIDKVLETSELKEKISDVLKTPGGPVAALVGYMAKTIASASSSIASARIISFDASSSRS